VRDIIVEQLGVDPEQVFAAGKALHTHNRYPQLALSPAHGLVPVQKPDAAIQRFVVDQIDVVFPVLHGPNGEDGTVQGMCELANVPYVGCDVLSSALGMDKIMQKRLFRAAGLPVVDFLEVRRRDWENDAARVMATIEATFTHPLFVKPACLGSSVGVSKVHNRAELGPALDLAARYGRKLLVEIAVPNAREIEISVLGNDDPIASLPGEIVPANEFYDYAAKYELDSALRIPAPLEPAQVAEFQQLALAAFRALDCCGMARVDFLMDGQTGAAYINEINTIPGFTPISMYPKLWEASGISYRELVDRLVQLALERHREKNMG